MTDEFVGVHDIGAGNKTELVKSIAADCDVKSFSFDNLKFGKADKIIDLSDLLPGLRDCRVDGANRFQFGRVRLNNSCAPDFLPNSRGFCLLLS